MSHTNPVARIETSMGTITVELDIEKAPVTVANFIEYAKSAFTKTPFSTALSPALWSRVAA